MHIQRIKGTLLCVFSAHRRKMAIGVACAVRELLLAFSVVA